MTKDKIKLAREAIETAKQLIPVRFAQVHDRLTYALEQLAEPKKDASDD